MNKLLITYFLVLVFFFFLPTKSLAIDCTSPNQCLRTCTSTLPNNIGTCTNSKGIGGVCCSTSTSTGGSGSWGSWGNTPAGTSLTDFSNLLGSKAPPNSSKASWENVLSTFLSLIFLVAIIISLAFLILGGYNWMFSGGDKEKVTKARQHVTFAIVGLVIIFISVLIVTVLGTFFRINFLSLP